MPKLLVLLVLALSLAGLWISDFLTDLHAPSLHDLSDESILMGLCSGKDQEASAFDCKQVVLDERWGYVQVPVPVFGKEETQGGGGAVEKRVFRLGWRPIPVSQLGTFYYFFLLAWFLFVGRPRPEWRKWHLLPLGISAAAALASIFYIGVMATMESGCRLCLALHGLNFLLLGILWAQWRRAGREKPAAPAIPLRKAHVGAALAYAATLCAISWVQRGNESTIKRLDLEAGQCEARLSTIRNDTEFLFDAFQGARPVKIPARATQSTLGDRNAPLELVLFSDLQCPNCKKFEGYFFSKIFPLFQGALKVTFRHFPLCPECNPAQAATDSMPRGLHPQSCAAAYALEAAALQGGDEAFWKMYGLIHRNQAAMERPDFVPEGLERSAESLGLDLKRFRKEMAGEAVRRAVDEDAALGAALELDGTPSLFLDGRRITPFQRANMGFWIAAAVAYGKIRISPTSELRDYREEE